MTKPFIVTLLFTLLAACLAIPETLPNAGGEQTYTTQHSSYAPGSRGGVDIYAPRHAVHAPVVVFFYGGSWQSGDKSMYSAVGEALAESGVVAIIPDYRVYPAVTFPGFLQDAAQSVRWSRDNAADYGGDPDHIILMGHSAGAYIAAMLAFDPQWLAAVGLTPARDIRGMIGLAGPYDFLPLDNPTLKIIFGPPQYLASTQPINFVAPGAPPAFLAAGLRDGTVDPSNTTRLASRLRAMGDRVTMKLYPGLDHQLIITAVSPAWRASAPVLPDCLDFIHRQTGTPALAHGNAL